MGKTKSKTKKSSRVRLAQTHSKKNPKGNKPRKTNKKTQKASNPLFTSDNFNSGDGMMTASWGPAVWHSLHMISFNYPTNPTARDKRVYSSFIKSLQNVLPCKYCRTNLKKNFKQLPLTNAVMKNRETFSRYIYKLHELINTMLNKPPSNITYEYVRHKYEQFRSRCVDKTSDTENDNINSNSDKHITITSKNKTQKIKRKGEKGCVDPLHGIKSKCVVKIIKV